MQNPILNQLIAYQFLRASDSFRSPSSCSTVRDLYLHLARLKESPPPTPEEKEQGKLGYLDIKDDFILVVLDLGECAGELTDEEVRERIADGKISRKPMLTVESFINAFGEK